MALRLLQLTLHDGQRAVAAVQDDGSATLVSGFTTIYALAAEAIASGRGLANTVAALAIGPVTDVKLALSQGRVLSPIDHVDPAHMWMTGTGLTHLGSAEGRDKMHKDLNDPAKDTDSMKMFKLGLERGKPQVGDRGAQPEWFYKGSGATVVAPEGVLGAPDFALDGSEEPEIVGVYLIGPDGQPWRIGFALSNEFSDHVLERQNYLYLAHSKLRPSSFGPEILIDELPSDIRGASRIRRGGEIIWEKPFLSGEENMSHSIRNLEEHHFKYSLFRQPGDVHVHFFGTATLSFSDGIRTEPGDVFEIEAAPFTLPLRNRFSMVKSHWASIKTL